jgi:hypothetical protein
LAFAITFLVAIGGELAQLMTSRSASLHDLGNDVIGIISFLLFAAVFDRRIRQRLKPVPKITVALVAVLGLIMSLGPLIWQSYAYVQRLRAAPEILDFENSWQSQFYESHGGAVLSVVSSHAGWPVDGNRSLLAELGNYSYSGVGIAPIADWSTYSVFSFVMASADSRSLRVTVRINDRSHNNEYRDRFNKNYIVTEKPQRITVPITTIERAPRNRNMKMDEVALILVFISKPTGDEKLLFDDFRLDND